MLKTNTFINNNWKWILGLFAYVVVGYSGYKGMQTDVETNTRRLQTYINEIKELKNDVNDLKIEIAVLTANQDCE